MRREKTQISKIRNKEGEITIKTKEIQGIIRDYFENLYTNKLENVEEMDKLLDTYDHPKLNQDINHRNRPITHNEIEAVIVSQKSKVQDLTDSSLHSARPLIKEEMITIILKLFHKIKREGTLPNSLYETSIKLIPKVDKDTSKN
jgi:hypothetical protein